MIYKQATDFWVKRIFSFFINHYQSITHNMKFLNLLVVSIFCSTLFAHAQSQQGSLSDYKDQSANKHIPTVNIDQKPTTEALQATLYELIAQYHAVQQAHWNVQGPLFYSLHDLLGEMYHELLPLIDMTAERMRALNAAADGRPALVARTANLGHFPDGTLTDKQVLDLLTKRYKALSDHLGEQVKTTGQSDVSSQDLLIDVKRTIELHLWKLRAFQQ